MTNTELAGHQWFEPTTLIGDEVIVCGGDSFTKFPIYDKLGIKTWPQILSEHFQRRVVVVGQPGACNKLIQQKVTEQLVSGHKIHMVVVLWTTMARTMWKRSDDFYENLRPISTYSQKQIERIEMDSFKTIFSKIIDSEYVHQLIDESINSFYNLQEQLKSKNIPYKFFWYRDVPISAKNAASVFVKHPLYPHIENFVGWPLFYELGGSRLVDEPQFFGGNDILKNHPNQLGHDEYAKLIIQQLSYHLN